MKKIENEKNKKFIKDTLNESKALNNSVNIFIKKNKLGGNNNQNKIPQDSDDTNQKKQNIFSKNKNKIKEENDEDLEEEDDVNNNIDDDDEGIFTYEYITSNIERYKKQVNKFDELVKKNLLLSKKYPNKKDEYKDEAIRALKKKKFYSKALERYENKKLKLELKSLDREYQMQKKELKKLTKDLKRKVRLVTMGGHYDDDDIGGDDSGSDEEDNDAMFAQIDLDDNALNQQYEQIIAMPEVKNACDNLNLFKFIFQED